MHPRYRNIIWGSIRTGNRSQQDATASSIISALRQCTSPSDLPLGLRLHSDAAASGYHSNIFVANALLLMYSRCAAMSLAARLFASLPHSRNAVSWNTLISGYSDNGDHPTALALFHRMRAEQLDTGGCAPTARSFVAAIKAVTGLADVEPPADQRGLKPVSLERGTGLHSLATAGGFDSDVFVASSLLNMYARCGAVGDAVRLFSALPEPARRSDVCWSTMVNAHAEAGDGGTALDVFCRMDEYVAPTCRTLVAALKACGELAGKERGRAVDRRVVKVDALRRAREVQARVVDGTCEWDVFVGNSLIDVFSKCGSVEDARKVFDRMPCRSVVSWTAMVLGYVEVGEYEVALELFRRMEDEECVPNTLTYVAALKACTGLAGREVGEVLKKKVVKKECLERGMRIHLKLADTGWDTDIFVANTLLDMYANCGSVVDARRVFDRMMSHDVVSWNNLILGCAENQEEDLAFELFAAMQQPDARTVVAALKACTATAFREECKPQADGKVVKAVSLARGRKIHGVARRIGCCSDMFVASMLVDLYAKCGSVWEARSVFDGMAEHDVVVWTSMILTYAESEQGKAALDLFVRMRDQGCTPNFRTFLAALKACESLVAVEYAKAIHGEICLSGCEEEPLLAHSLLDVYAKCGSIRNAEVAFDAVCARDVVPWNTLLAGYGRQGNTRRAFQLFQRMRDEGIRANNITFVTMLTACSHAGLVEKAKKLFQAMQTPAYGSITPCIEHFICLVDVLGRANEIDEAVELVKRMPYQATAVVWRSILAACRKWKNVEAGRTAFEKLLSLEEGEIAGYMLMGNIYGSVGMWEEQSGVEMRRLKARVGRKAGVSWWTDSAGEVHSFVVGDASRHERGEEIVAKLKEVMGRVKSGGEYVAHVDSVVDNISESEKEETLGVHSEKLALACALINTGDGAGVTIIKNLRMCEDCHLAFAAISKVEKREIICRDASRFHCFAAGKCSCQDYW